MTVTEPKAAGTALDSPPRVLFLNKAPPYRTTGAEFMVWQLGNHLAAAGWDVHYLTPLEGPPPRRENITFHEVETPDSFLAGQALFFINGIPNYRTVVRSLDPDLIYDNASPFPFVFAYLSDPDRLVTKSHTMIDGWRALLNKHHYTTKLGTFVGDQLFRLMDGRKILTVSESAKERFAERVLRHPGAITAIPNGIDRSAFIDEFSPDGPVLSLCELTPRKNIDVLLRAWKRIEATDATEGRRLIVAGDGPSRARLEALSDRLATETVSFTGYVSEEKKRDLLRRAYCYVLPTWGESFGLTNIEAMASGCVVVSTHTHGVKDYLVNGRNGLTVPTGSVGALADALSTVLTDEALGRKLVAGGRETANDHRIENSVERERAVLERLLASRSG
jgi:glycosyltransferase involved in cell wall biosynthesis